MGRTITGTFSTRWKVEPAIEHRLPEYGIKRTDIFIKPKSDENSTASRAGADAKGRIETSRDGASPDLNGPILVRDIYQDDTVAVEKAFHDAGAIDFAER